MVVEDRFLVTKRPQCLTVNAMSYVETSGANFFEYEYVLTSRAESTEEDILDQFHRLIPGQLSGSVVEGSIEYIDIETSEQRYAHLRYIGQRQVDQTLAVKLAKQFRIAWMDVGYDVSSAKLDSLVTDKDEDAAEWDTVTNLRRLSAICGTDRVLTIDEGQAGAAAIGVFLSKEEASITYAPLPRELPSRAAREIDGDGALTGGTSALSSGNTFIGEQSCLTA